MRRILVAATAALAVVSLLAACGGGGGDDVDNTTGLTPAEIVQRSSDAARDLRSFRLAFELDGTADLGISPTSSLGSILGGEIKVDGEGPVHPPDQASIDATLTLSGLPVQANLTRVGDQVVLSALGTNIGLNVPRDQLALLNFGDVYPELASWLVDPTEDGHERVDGVQTVKITGAIDPDTAVSALGPLLGGGAPDPGAADGLTGTATLWIATEDFVPRRAHVTLTGSAAGITAGAGEVDLTLEANLSEIDSAADVVLPQVDDTMDLDQLGSLIGG